jgi:phosphatidylserine/phosphatidylglycerophosphate/cardiolipin synthase-like enzyme
MCHAKVAIIDDRALVGSANLNHSSYFNHYEIVALVDDAGFAQRLKRDLFETDAPWCRTIRPEDLPALLDINAAAHAWLRAVVLPFF